MLIEKIESEHCYFIYSNPYIYITVVQEVYNWNRSPEADDVERLAAADTKHLDLLKRKDEAESIFIDVD